MEKTFCCVTTVIRDNMPATFGIVELAVEEKPRSAFRHTSHADYYVDWFDTKDEAENFIKEQE